MLQGTGDVSVWLSEGQLGRLGQGWEREQGGKRGVGREKGDGEG